MLRWLREEVKAMANVIRNSTTKFNLDTLTDEEINTIISNTQDNIASLGRFLSEMTNERVRRGLKLPTPRAEDTEA